MEYFEDIYLKRLNRYGIDYQSRVQGRREEDFEYYLLKSVYRIDFTYNGEEHPGTFEAYKQDETQTLHYLLTRRDLNLPNGTILMIKNKDEEEKPWMVYWMEEIPVSGYNKYTMLKLTHYISWVARDGNTYSTWAYLYGQEDNMLKDELKSRSRSRVLYNENLIRKYEYQSNFLGKYVDVTDDWCFETKNGIITKQKVGGYDGFQMYGISYYDAKDGKQLDTDIKAVYDAPGGKEKYWDQIPLDVCKQNYKISVRECKENDIIEIDSLDELKALDSSYKNIGE